MLTLRSPGTESITEPVGIGEAPGVVARCVSSYGIRAKVGVHRTNARSWGVIGSGSTDGLGRRTPFIHGYRLVDRQLVHDVGVLHRARHFGKDRGLRPALVEVVANRGFTTSTAFGGNQDGSVGRTGTVDGRRGVLQN